MTNRHAQFALLLDQPEINQLYALWFTWGVMVAREELGSTESERDRAAQTLDWMLEHAGVEFLPPKGDEKASDSGLKQAIMQAVVPVSPATFPPAKSPTSPLETEGGSASEGAFASPVASESLDHHSV